MVSFKKHVLIRRSFELISLYLAPYHSLNLFLGPFTFDSKTAPDGDKSTGEAPKRLILPSHPQNIITRASTLPGDTLSEKSPTENVVSVGAFVREHCASLFRRWEPTWWLRSGHLQTFWSSAGDFTDVDPLQYERSLLELPDGGVIGVDFTEPKDESIDNNAPIIIVLPGLTGGSQASYVRSLLSITSKSRSQGGLGYRGIVINSRGCGNVPLRTPQISAGSADDLRSALLYIRTLYPDAPLFAVGFSLGATVLTKYLGEERADSEIQAGCVVACPWDLRKNSELLESRFFYRHIYSRALAKSYLALLHRSLPTLQVPSGSVFHQHLEIIRTLKSPTFTQVNTHVTSIIGGAPPIFPHATVEDFYAWASCATDLGGVSVPLLCINADDDPIVNELPYDEVHANEGGWVAMVVTRGGGHLGWFEKEGKRRWISKPIVEWFKALAEQVVWPETQDRTAEENQRDVVTKHKELDGFIKVGGEKSHIGYRVLSTGGDPGDTAIPGALAGL